MCVTGSCDIYSFKEVIDLRKRVLTFETALGGKADSKDVPRFLGST